MGNRVGSNPISRIVCRFREERKMKKRVCFGLLILILTALFASAGMAATTSDAADTANSVGWHKTKSGKYYYILKNGSRAKGWLKYKGDYYYCDPKNYGYKVTGWVIYNTNHYYCDPAKGGALKSGWLTWRNNHYYLIPELHGRMCIGWRKIGSKFYRFSNKGARVYSFCFGQYIHLLNL